MVQWSQGPMVLWSHGPMVPWSHGPMVPWSHGKRKILTFHKNWFELGRRGSVWYENWLIQLRINPRMLLKAFPGSKTFIFISKMTKIIENLIFPIIYMIFLFSEPCGALWSPVEPCVGPCGARWESVWYEACRSFFPHGDAKTQLILEVFVDRAAPYRKKCSDAIEGRHWWKKHKHASELDLMPPFWAFVNAKLTPGGPGTSWKNSRTPKDFEQIENHLFWCVCVCRDL